MQRAQAQIEKGATVLFAHTLYTRPTFRNCEKLALRLGVPVILKNTRLSLHYVVQQKHTEEYVRACFACNAVNAHNDAVQWFVRQVEYAATYIDADGSFVTCFVCNERTEDILLCAYFNKTAHDEALYNETGVQARLEEAAALDAEAQVGSE